MYLKTSQQKTDQMQHTKDAKKKQQIIHCTKHIQSPKDKIHYLIQNHHKPSHMSVIGFELGFYSLRTLKEHTLQ